MVSVILCVRWWYGQGFKWVLQRGIVDRLNACAARFSLKDLIRTWFAPYKQTFAGGGGSGIGEWFRSAIDRMISRTVGFLVRSLLILAGIVCSIFVLITGGILLLAWPILPVFVLFSLILSGVLA